jgi:restriction endonuclease S subunit
VNELPTGWAWAELSQVCTSITDGDHQAPPQVPAGIPFLVIGNIRTRALDFTGCRHVPAEYFESLNPVRRPQKGDVLYSLVGSYGISVLVRDDKPFCVQRHIGILRPSPEISSAFLALALSSRAVFDQATKYATGTAQLTVSLSGLRRIRIPLPPHMEQERIVAAIEEQFSRLDAGVAALERARQELVALNKSIIISAIPETYPRHWQQTTVGEAGQVTLGRQRSPKYHKGPKMRRYLRVANIFEDRIDTEDIMSMQFEDAEFARYRLYPGDILLNEGQSPHLLGRPAMYRGDPTDVAFTNSLLRFRSGPGVLPEWALLVFRRHLHAKRFMRESQITTNIAHLSAGRFKTVEFPIPPIDEQERITGNVGALLSEAAGLCALIDPQQQRAKTLRSSILAAAFSGKLVAQDANDEPASVLLKRISSERAFSNGRGLARSRQPRKPPEQVTA